MGGTQTYEQFYNLTEPLRPDSKIDSSDEFINIYCSTNNFPPGERYAIECTYSFAKNFKSIVYSMVDDNYYKIRVHNQSLARVIINTSTVIGHISVPFETITIE